MAGRQTSRSGTRLRERRLDLGLRQADLAETVGISPSYLNLIEHNRRRIGPDLLARLANVLEIDQRLLADGAQQELVDQLHAASGAFHALSVETGKADDFAARYPGWAALVAAQADRTRSLENQLQLLADRITYDPALATALHGVISAVTSIRSTAAILTGDDALDADWQARFHRNIHDDAMRLADDSEALISYLDAPDDKAGLPMTPTEEAESWLAACQFHVPAVEAGETPQQVAAGAALSPAATQVLTDWLVQYAADAQALPLDDFASLARKEAYDPAALVQAFDVSAAAVLRRLASLPPGDGHPPVGLAVADRGGFFQMLKSVDGFALPRGTACPLWPVFSAASGTLDTALVALPGQRELTLLCHTMAEHEPVGNGLLPPRYRVTMAVLPDPQEGAGAKRPVGVSCRICPRAECAARREPSVLSQGQSRPL